MRGIAPRAVSGPKNEGVTDERMRKDDEITPEAVPSISPGSWKAESCSGTGRSQNPPHPNDPFNPLFLMPLAAEEASLTRDSRSQATPSNEKAGCADVGDTPLGFRITRGPHPDRLSSRKHYFPHLTDTRPRTNPYVKISRRPSAYRPRRYTQPGTKQDCSSARRRSIGRSCRTSRRGEGTGIPCSSR